MQEAKVRGLLFEVSPRNLNSKKILRYGSSVRALNIMVEKVKTRF
jgi:hypothetical protein